MEKCTCGKEFATVPQLRGHKIHCKARELAPESTPLEVKEAKKSNYKELPPPIVEFLEREIPNWLDKFEIGQEWKKDYGGYGMYVRVPKEFSVEYKEETQMEWDNRTRSSRVDEKGNSVTKKVIFKDERSCPLKDMSRVIVWLGRVISNITTAAQQKGLQLPPTRI